MTRVSKVTDASDEVHSAAFAAAIAVGGFSRGADPDVSWLTP